MVKGIEYNELQAKTQIYIESFKNKNFNIAEIKKEINKEWGQRRKPVENPADGRKGCYLYF